MHVSSNRSTAQLSAYQVIIVTTNDATLILNQVVITHLQENMLHVGTRLVRCLIRKLHACMLCTRAHRCGLLIFSLLKTRLIPKIRCWQPMCCLSVEIGLCATVKLQYASLRVYSCKRKNGREKMNTCSRRSRVRCNLVHFVILHVYMRAVGDASRTPSNVDRTPELIELNIERQSRIPFLEK